MTLMQIYRFIECVDTDQVIYKTSDVTDSLSQD